MAKKKVKKLTFFCFVFLFFLHFVTVYCQWQNKCNATYPQLMKDFWYRTLDRCFIFLAYVEQILETWIVSMGRKGSLTAKNNPHRNTGKHDVTDGKHLV